MRYNEDGENQMKCPMCGDEFVEEYVEKLRSWGYNVIRCPVCREPICIELGIKK